jgi:hypothetical protein
LKGSDLIIKKRYCQRLAPKEGLGQISPGNEGEKGAAINSFLTLESTAGGYFPYCWKNGLDLDFLLASRHSTEKIMLKRFHPKRGSNCLPLVPFFSLVSPVQHDHEGNEGGLSSNPTIIFGESYFRALRYKLTSTTANRNPIEMLTPLAVPPFQFFQSYKAVAPLRKLPREASLRSL